MSASNLQVRDALVRRHGEGYGREKWAWLMQKYNILPWDDVPQAMMVEAKVFNN